MSQVNILSTLKGVMLSPTLTFEYLAEKNSGYYHFLIFLLAGIAMGIVQANTVLVSGQYPAGIMMLLFLGRLFNLLFSWVYFSVLIHYFATFYGGNGGYGKLFRLLGYCFMPLCFTPLVLLLDLSFNMSIGMGILQILGPAAPFLLYLCSPISLGIGNIFVIYAFVLVVYAVKSEENISKLESLKSIGLAFIVVIIIMNFVLIMEFIVRLYEYIGRIL